MSVVTVKADKTGNVIHQSPNNPEFGWIFVEQTTNEFSGGWLRSVKRSARIMGGLVDFKNAGYKKGTEIPGKIVVQESLVPFDVENPDRDLKIAGNTGVICRLDDEPIYRRSIFTTNVNAHDEFIGHTNVQEIRDVQEAQRQLSTLSLETAETATL